MKTGKFNKVEFHMTRGNGYGQYYIHSTYKGKVLKIHTTNSEAWDWIDDDTNKEKHMNALRHCYHMIVNEYNN